MGLGGWNLCTQQGRRCPDPHPLIQLPPPAAPALYAIPRKGIKASPSKAEALSASERELEFPLLWDRAHAAHTLLARAPHRAVAGLVLEMGIVRIRAASQALPAQGAQSRWRPCLSSSAVAPGCGHALSPCAHLRDGSSCSASHTSPSPSGHRVDLSWEATPET